MKPRSIKTNHILYDFNYPALNNKYDIYYFEGRNEEKNGYRRIANLLDELSEEKKILAIKHKHSTSFYALMEKSGDNRAALLRLLEELPDGRQLTFKKIEADSLEKYQLAQLLMNSLGSSESKYIRFNNLTGYLYASGPHLGRTSAASKTFQGSARQVYALDIKIDSHDCLSGSGVTFSRKDLCDKKPYKGPVYICSSNHTIRRCLKEKDVVGDLYIKKQSSKKKHSFPFLNFASYAHFQSSKVACLLEVYQRFNKKFAGLAQIRLDEVKEYDVLPCPSGVLLKEKLIKILKEQLGRGRLRLINRVRAAQSPDEADDENGGAEDESETDETLADELCACLADYLRKDYGLEVIQAEDLSADDLNLLLIRSPEFYENHALEDPYIKGYEEGVLQHLTVDLLAEHLEALKLFSSAFDHPEKELTRHEKRLVSTMKSVMANILSEIAIKDDIHKRQINLFDWAARKEESRISLLRKKTQKDAEGYFVMHIEPDGSICFEDSEEPYPEDISDELKIQIDHDILCGSGKYEAFIYDGKGNVNAIVETPLITLPEGAKIKEELQNNNTALRNKKMQDELFTGVLDIKFFRHNDAYYYFSGTIGKGMQSCIPHAVHIREIKTYGSKLFFRDYLDTMAVPFVRFGRLTVMPFPLKYLREYASVLSGKAEKQEAGTEDS